MRISTNLLFATLNQVDTTCSDGGLIPQNILDTQPYQTPLLYACYLSGTALNIPYLKRKYSLRKPELLPNHPHQSFFPVNLLCSAEFRGDSSSSDHLSPSSPTANMVSPSNDCRW